MIEVGPQHREVVDLDASGTAHIFDRSCGRCDVCQLGWSVWCEQMGEGRALCSIPTQLSVSFATAMLMATSALMVANLDGSAVVAVFSPLGDEALFRLVQLVHRGTVVATSDLRDPVFKSYIAGISVTGRPDAIVTVSGGRDAVMAVKRGGIVCLANSVADMPSVTELAQREVRVLGPRDLSAVVEFIGRKQVEDAFNIGISHVEIGVLKRQDLVRGKWKGSGENGS